MESTVKLYASDEGFTVYTDATDERDFVQAAASALADKGVKEGDLAQYLPRVIDIVCKLRGYKAPSVIEKRVFIAGPGVLPADALVVEANHRGIVRAEA